jgi:hypothetical protein
MDGNIVSNLEYWSNGSVFVDCDLTTTPHKRLCDCSKTFIFCIINTNKQCCRMVFSYIAFGSAKEKLRSTANSNTILHKIINRTKAKKQLSFVLVSCYSFVAAKYLYRKRKKYVYCESIPKKLKCSKQ